MNENSSNSLSENFVFQIKNRDSAGYRVLVKDFENLKFLFSFETLKIIKKFVNIFISKLNTRKSIENQTFRLKIKFINFFICNSCPSNFSIFSSTFLNKMLRSRKLSKSCEVMY